MGWGDIKDRLNAQTYKGFRIVPNRICITVDGEPDKYRVSVEIQREGGDKPPKTFTKKGKYASTEQDAIRQSLEYGKKVIDGEVAGESVADL